MLGFDCSVTTLLAQPLEFPHWRTSKEKTRPP
jgi:hypothetical protein